MEKPYENMVRLGAAQAPKSSGQGSQTVAFPDSPHPLDAFRIRTWPRFLLHVSRPVAVRLPRDFSRRSHDRT